MQKSLHIKFTENNIELLEMQLRAIVGITSHIKIFLVICKQPVLCMDCQFMK